MSENIINALATEFKNRQAALDEREMSVEKRARQNQHALSKNAVYNALLEVYGFDAAEKFWSNSTVTL